MEFLKKFFNGFTLEKVIRRLLTSWFFACFISAVSSPAPEKGFLYFEKSSIASVSFILHVFIIFALFIVLSALFTLAENEKAEKLILLVSLLPYAFLCASSEADAIWVMLGICAVIFLVCKYALGDADECINFKFSKRSMVITAVICGCIFTAFLGVQAVCRVKTQSSPCFDFGIFSQMYYYMKETLQPLVTCERAVLLSHFDVHVSPIYYLFLPFFAIVPKPETLVVCQTLLLASGIIPLVLLCRQLKLSYKSTALFTICYTFYPTVMGGCYYDLHENKFLLPLMLWLFYFIEKNKWWGIITFSALTLLVKEDAPVYIAFVAIFLFVSKKDFKKGAVLLAMSVLYFLIVVAYLETFGYSGIMSNRYNNFIYEDGGGLLSVIKSVLISPANVIREVLDPEVDSVGTKIGFMLSMLTPLCFLPFVTKKYSRYILLGPFVLVNLMPDYVYQHSLYFQYTYGSGACLFYLAVMNYSELSQKFKRTTGAVIALASMIFFSGTVAQKPDYLENYLANKENHDYVAKALAAIPEDASVVASGMYVTDCSQRREVYSLDDTNYKNSPTHTDYVVLDLRYKSNRNIFKNAYQNNDDYELLAYRENWVAVLRCCACAMGVCDG